MKSHISQEVAGQVITCNPPPPSPSITSIVVLSCGKQERSPLRDSSALMLISTFLDHTSMWSPESSETGNYVLYSFYKKPCINLERYLS